MKARSTFSVCVGDQIFSQSEVHIRWVLRKYTQITACHAKALALQSTITNVRKSVKKRDRSDRDEEANATRQTSLREKWKNVMEGIDRVSAKRALLDTFWISVKKSETKYMENIGIYGIKREWIWRKKGIDSFRLLLSNTFQSSPDALPPVALLAPPHSFV